METVEGKIIEENEVNRDGGGCSSCKQKGIKKGQIGSVILGLYIMGSAVYGTIVMIENLLSLFKN
jgi:hypothetical protein